MSNSLNEIIKSNLSVDSNTDSCILGQQDHLEFRIKNAINSASPFTGDIGAHAFNPKIDNWVSIIKRNILEEYEEIKSVLKDLSKDIIIKEIKRFEDDMLQLRNSNIEYQNQINSLKVVSTNYKKNIKGLSSKLSQNTNKLIEAKYMFNWRLRKEQIHRQNFCEKIAIKFYQFSIMRKVFNGWKHGLEMTWKNRNNSKIEREAKSVYQKLVNEYEKQIIDLRYEITRLEDENITMQTSRSATQEAVKKALMRGVCALNMETMNILNQNGIISETHNNDCFQNGTNNSKTFIPLLENIEHYEDQPRFPLKKYNSYISRHDDHMKLSSMGTSNNAEELGFKKIDNLISKRERIPNQSQTSIPNHVNHLKTKNHLQSEIFSIPKQNHLKNSTITVQAGNPTGSHTQTVNPSINISVQRHFNDSL